MNTKLTIYHRGEMNSVNQILALAESNQVKAVEKNICKTKLTGTQLIQLAAKMKVQLKELTDKNADSYTTVIKDKNYNEMDWITLLTNHPEVIKTPIAETATELIYINTPTDVLKLKNIDKSIDAYQHIKNQSN